MSSNVWKEATLGEILNFRRGHDLPKTKMNKGVIPVIGSNGVIGYHNEFTTPAPCLSIGRSGNIGNPHFSNENSWAHNTTLYVDDFKGNDPHFLYYLLKTLRLSEFGGGSAVPTLNRNHIHPLKVKYPEDLNEQKAIAHVLSTFDDKIEVNNRINKTLEDMAQAIFKRWFVDFEFPNHDEEPYKSSGGEMVESELGMIPKGWETGVLTDQADILSGGTPKTSIKEYWDGEIPFFTPKDCNDIYTFETEKYLSRTGLNNCNSRLFEKGTTLITARGTVGKVTMAGRDTAMNQSCYAIKAKSIEFDLLTYFFVVNGIKTLQKNATGSVFNSIIVSTFNTIKIVIPEGKLLLKFNQILKPMFDLIHTLLLESNQLKKSRDVLLPKLISGEIRVPIEES